MSVTELSNEVIMLKGKDIDNRMFNAALNRLMQFQFTDPKLSYNLGYISKQIQAKTKDLMHEHGKLLDKYATKDENGKFVLDEKMNVSISDENQEKYKEDLKLIHEVDLEIRKRKLDVNVLSQQGFAFSANDISVLEPLLCGLED